jgi:hypothetical protein
MASVYLETTIPSYLASRPSRDLVVAAHQQITQDWWWRARQRFDLYISEAVLEEIRTGDAEAASRRLESVHGLPVLALTPDVRSLARVYSTKLRIPERARADIVHIACAVSYGIDYLLTWNCKHIANGYVIQQLLELNRELQRATPVLVTPEELLDLPGETDS